MTNPNSEKITDVEAIMSFGFGLTFWIPLLNLIFTPISLILGIRSVMRIRKEPLKYSGTGFAVTGIILSSIAIIMISSGFGMCVIGYKEICESMGLHFFT